MCVCVCGGGGGGGGGGSKNLIWGRVRNVNMYCIAAHLLSCNYVTVNYECLIKCKKSVECHQTLTLLGRVWDLRLDSK